MNKFEMLVEKIRLVVELNQLASDEEIDVILIPDIEDAIDEVNESS